MKVSTALRRAEKALMIFHRAVDPSKDAVADVVRALEALVVAVKNAEGKEPQ